MSVKAKTDRFEAWLKERRGDHGAVFSRSAVEGLFAMAGSKTVAKDHVEQSVELALAAGVTPAYAEGLRRLGEQVILFEADPQGAAPRRDPRSDDEAPSAFSQEPQTRSGKGRAAIPRDDFGEERPSRMTRRDPRVDEEEGPAPASTPAPRHEPPSRGPAAAAKVESAKAEAPKPAKVEAPKVEAPKPAPPPIPSFEEIPDPPPAPSKAAPPPIPSLVEAPAPPPAEAAAPRAKAPKGTIPAGFGEPTPASPTADLPPLPDFDATPPPTAAPPSPAPASPAPVSPRPLAAAAPPPATPRPSPPPEPVRAPSVAPLAETFEPPAPAEVDEPRPTLAEAAPPRTSVAPKAPTPAPATAQPAAPAPAPRVAQGPRRGMGPLGAVTLVVISAAGAAAGTLALLRGGYLVGMLAERPAAAPEVADAAAPTGALLAGLNLGVKFPTGWQEPTLNPFEPHPPGFPEGTAFVYRGGGPNDPEHGLFIGVRPAGGAVPRHGAEKEDPHVTLARIAEQGAASRIAQEGGQYKSEGCELTIVGGRRVGVCTGAVTGQNTFSKLRTYLLMGETRAIVTVSLSRATVANAKDEAEAVVAQLTP